MIAGPAQPGREPLNRAIDYDFDLPQTQPISGPFFHGRHSLNQLRGGQTKKKAKRHETNGILRLASDAQHHFNRGPHPYAKRDP